MAVPLTTKSFRDALVAVLDDAFNEPGSWAVYYDYDQSDMTYKIAKVEPWDYWDHSMDGPGARRHPRPGIMKIAKAPDELGAYAEAMRRLEETDK